MARMMVDNPGALFEGMLAAGARPEVEGRANGMPGGIDPLQMEGINGGDDDGTLDEAEDEALGRAQLQQVRQEETTGSDGEDEENSDVNFPSSHFASLDIDNCLRQAAPQQPSMWQRWTNYMWNFTGRPAATRESNDGAGDDDASSEGSVDSDNH